MSIQTPTPTATENIIDTSILEEMIRWIKSLTAVGVSPDTAANVTSRFLIAACDLASEQDDDEDDEYYEE